jgi:hypothetical protein
VGEVGPIASDGWGLSGSPRVFADTFWHATGTLVAFVRGECATVGLWVEHGWYGLVGLVATAILRLGGLHGVGREGALLKNFPTYFLLPLRCGPPQPSRLSLGAVSSRCLLYPRGLQCPLGICAP